VSDDVFELRLRRRLDLLASQGLARRLPAVSHRDGPRYHLDGRPVVGFCSNDYLGFADRPELRTAPPGPVGSTASRLISGDLPIHRRLETRLADIVDQPAAVLFPSGFQANVGSLPAVLDSHDRVHSDALNHASLIDGLRLSKPSAEILQHRASPPRSEPQSDRLSWWVTESIFSMDGDTADPQALAHHLAHGGCLYLDDAHGFGLFSRGAGWAAHHGLRPTLMVGTLGKAVGCAGAFVAGSTTACEWLRTRARSFVFTTGPSPTLLQRIDVALNLLTSPEGDAARDQLWRLAIRFADHFDLPSPPSPIFPFLIGDNQTTLTVAQSLLEQGWHVQPIRPPTVPFGTARLRVTLSAAHTPAQVDAFANDLRDQLAHHGVPPRVERGRTQPTHSASNATGPGPGPGPGPEPEPGHGHGHP
jgi:7-keto-8-aminopelargonate synthetase-like enzyme